MKTDKELLELAAKAAGELHLVPYKEEWLLEPEAWNPLLRNDDALELAVRLNILIDIGKSVTSCASFGLEPVHVNHEENPYAATRRAIVRAAAAIGEKL